MKNDSNATAMESDSQKSQFEWPSDRKVTINNVLAAAQNDGLDIEEARKLYQKACPRTPAVLRMIGVV